MLRSGRSNKVTYHSGWQGFIVLHLDFGRQLQISQARQRACASFEESARSTQDLIHGPDSDLELGQGLLHLLFLLGTIHNLSHLLLELMQLKLEQIIQLELVIDRKVHLHRSMGHHAVETDVIDPGNKERADAHSFQMCQQRSLLRDCNTTLRESVCCCADHCHWQGHTFVVVMSCCQWRSRMAGLRRSATRGTLVAKFFRL